MAATSVWMDLLRGVFTYVNGVLVDSGRALAFNFIGTGIAGSYNPETGIVDVDLSDLAGGGGGGSSGIGYVYDNSTSTATDPGSGQFRLNNATLASVTAIAISDVNSDAANIEAYLLARDDSTSPIRGTITIRRTSAPTNFAIYNITGTSTDSAGWVQFVVTHVQSAGAFVDGNSCSIEFARTGDVGTSGTNGTSSSIRYLFATSTTTNADPSAGNFRLNNATLASVTAAAFADTDANGGNNELYLLAQDDSTTTGHRGYIIIRKLSAPSTFAIYDITGTSTDSAGWVQFVLTYVTANGTFSAADDCGVQFYRTGDAASGTQGIAGLTYLFATSTTTSADPSAGNFRLNNATHASATAAAFADTDSNGNASEAFLLAQDDSTTTANRGQITIRSRTTPATFRIYNITGTSTDSAGWVQFVLTYVVGSGSLSASEPCDVIFTRTGDAGLAVAAGTTGQLQYNSGGTQAGAAITTSGSDLTGVTRLNSVFVASGVLGAALTDASTTISVAGGSIYELNVNLTANRSVGLAITGSPRDKQVISIRKYTTAAFNLTINDEVGNPLYVFPQAVKGIADFQYSTGTAKFAPIGNMDLA